MKELNLSETSHIMCLNFHVGRYNAFTKTVATLVRLYIAKINYEFQAKRKIFRINRDSLT